MPDPGRLRPGWFVGIGIVATRRPHSGAAVEHVHRLIEKQPEPPLRIGPEIADEDTALFPESLFMRIENHSGVGPGFSFVVAARENKERIRAVAATNPAGPESTTGGAFDPNRHAVVEPVVAVFRKRRGIYHRRHQRVIGDLFHLLDTGGGFFRGLRDGGAVWRRDFQQLDLDIISQNRHSCLSKGEFFPVLHSFSVGEGPMHVAL